MINVILILTRNISILSVICIILFNNKYKNITDCDYVSFDIVMIIPQWTYDIVTGVILIIKGKKIFLCCPCLCNIPVTVYKKAKAPTWCKSLTHTDDKQRHKAEIWHQFCDFNRQELKEHIMINAFID